MIAAADRLTGVDGGMLTVMIDPALVHLFSPETELALATSRIVRLHGKS